jgi:hypothetical protein
MGTGAGLSASDGRTRGSELICSTSLRSCAWGGRAVTVQKRERERLGEERAWARAARRRSVAHAELRAKPGRQAAGSKNEFSSRLVDHPGRDHLIGGTFAVDYLYVFPCVSYISASLMTVGLSPDSRAHFIPLTHSSRPSLRLYWLGRERENMHRTSECT